MRNITKFVEDLVNDSNVDMLSSGRVWEFEEVLAEESNKISELKEMLEKLI